MTKKLIELLGQQLDSDERAQLVGGYDVVGDIAVVLVPSALAHRESLIGQTILDHNPRVRTVVKRDGVYAGQYRLPSMAVIAGERRTHTVVKEFGLSLSLDLNTVYYSVRSGAERHRIASLVTAEEEVLVLFSGVGPYPLMIEKFGQASTIVAVEKNPEAHRFALTNHRRNGSPSSLLFLLGDAARLKTAWTARFNRVIMPLPRGGEAYLSEALRVLAPGGHLHYYQLLDPNAEAQAADVLASLCAARGRVLLDARLVRCGHTAPRSYRVCLDALIG